MVHHLWLSDARAMVNRHMPTHRVEGQLGSVSMEGEDHLLFDLNGGGGGSTSLHELLHYANWLSSDSLSGLRPGIG